MLFFYLPTKLIINFDIRKRIGVKVKMEFFSSISFSFHF